MEVICVKDKGYKWSEYDGSFFRGYVQLYDEDDTVLRGREAVDYFASAGNFEDFTVKLKECDGVFAVIVRKNDSCWAAVDAARSMPLYYSSDCSCISDSSEEVRRYKNIAPEDTDYLRTIEMFKTEFVAHDRTIYDGIRQLEMGHAAEFSGGRVKTSAYFIHSSAMQDITREEAVRQLREKTDVMIRRLLKVIDGRPLVLSLSGGYDSRYLACSFRQYGVKNIACYTYGGGGSYEVPDSKRVADALGYEWHCVKYTDENQLELTSEQIRPYYEYTKSHDYFMYLQNYTAVKELQEGSMIPQDAVMITGLCNDMPSGLYVPSEKQAEGYGFTLEGAARFIVDGRFPRDFIHRRLNRDVLRKDEYCSFVEEVKSYLDSLGLEVHDYQSFVGAVDCVTTGYMHSRCFLHMNDIHEFFGHEWLLPCWDRELLKFWYSLPAEMRQKQNLYEDYVTGTLGRQWGLTRKKHESLTARPKVSVVHKVLLKIREILQGLLYPLGIVIFNNRNNVAPNMAVLYKRVRQKKALKSALTASNHFWCVYLMEQKYGLKWFERIRQALN